MGLSLRQRLNLGFGLALLFLVVIGGISYWSTVRLSRSAARVDQTDKILTAIEDTASQAKDVETDARGYVITGQVSYVAAFDRDVQEVQASLERARGLTAGNVREQAAVDS